MTDRISSLIRRSIDVRERNSLKEVRVKIRPEIHAMLKSATIEDNTSLQAIIEACIIAYVHRDPGITAAIDNWIEKSAEKQKKDPRGAVKFSQKELLELSKLIAEINHDD